MGKLFDTKQSIMPRFFGGQGKSESVTKNIVGLYDSRKKETPAGHNKNIDTSLTPAQAKNKKAALKRDQDERNRERDAYQGY